MGIHKKAKAAAVSDSDGGSAIPSLTPCRAEIEIEIRSRMGGGAKWKGKNQILSACSSSAHATSSSWSCGAKRKRALTGVGVNKSGSGTRDWANLGDGPAGLIADLALAHDVADYIRFRAVCRPWRRCSPDPTGGDGLDARFLPRQWMMLDKAHATTRRRRFLNVSTGECIRMDLPELAEHRLLSLTPEGLLLLFHGPCVSLRLLNPLTRRLTHLPPNYPPFLTPVVGGAGLIHHHHASASASKVTVAVNFCSSLAVVKPGDDTWTVVYKHPTLFIYSTLPFAGRFYCATMKGVMELDIGSSGPRLVMAAKPPRSTSIPFNPSFHLVDIDNGGGGELMLVHRPYHENFFRFQLYRLDLDAGVLVPAKLKPSNGHGRALFVGNWRAISVSTQAFPSLNAHTLYLGFDCQGKSCIDAYDLANGSIIKPPRQDQLLPWNGVDPVRKDNGPPTVADCLSHCIRSSGCQLA